MELKIEQYELKPIGFNFEELKKELESQLEKYQNLVFTDDTMKDAKKTRTDLNKLVETIESERKRIKKEWNQPYVDFENKIKELVALVNKPKLAIETQIKRFEDKQKEEKLDKLKKYFESINECNYLTFDMIFDEKWLNVSADVKKVKEAITNKVGSFATGITIIEGQDERYRTFMLDKYLQTLDISQALLEKERIEKLEFEQKKNKIAAEIKADVKADGFDVTDSKDDDIEILDFRVHVTKIQKQLLKEFLIANKIEYGRVE